MKNEQDNYHKHLIERMRQRGIAREEIETTLNKGWPAIDTKPGALGKSMVFLYNADWEGKQFEEKEVTVYYKIKNERVVILTAIARYGSNFPKKGDVK